MLLVFEMGELLLELDASVLGDDFGEPRFVRDLVLRGENLDDVALF